MQTPVFLPHELQLYTVKKNFKASMDNKIDTPTLRCLPWVAGTLTLGTFAVDGVKRDFYRLHFEHICRKSFPISDKTTLQLWNFATEPISVLN